MKKYIYISILIITSLIFNSCEDDITEPTGLQYITIDKTHVLGLEQNSSISTEVTIFTTTKLSSDTVFDLDITSDLDPAAYSLPSSVTMPANSNKAVIPIEFSDTNLNGKGGTVSIGITPLDGYYVGDDSVDIGVALCPSDISGTYDYIDGNEKTGIDIVKESDNLYYITGDNRYNSNYWFDITYECNSIVVTGNGALSDFGFPVSGKGFIKPNGDIEIVYTASGLFSNRTMTLAKQ